MLYDMEDNDTLALINEICAEYEGLLAEKSLQLRVHSTLEDPTASFDRTRIGQVARNLLSNAIKFTEPERALTIELAPVEISAGRRKSDAGKVVPGMSVSVRDQGVGIPEEELDAVFRQVYPEQQNSP